VFAAAGMVLAGCESPAGVGNGYDDVVSTEASASVLNSAGDGAAKKIKVKFNVKNGGSSLMRSDGIVSTQDDSYLVCDWDAFANDFDITITVPASDEYLNIRWKGLDFWGNGTYVKAKMKPESGTITLDYNGKGKVATKNLYDVRVDGIWLCFKDADQYDFYRDWESAKKYAVKD